MTDDKKTPKKRCCCIFLICLSCAAICLCVLLAITDVLGISITHNKIKVCVIGAGGAGLATLKELSSYPNDFEPIGFEINSDIGGLWIYSDNGDLNEHGLPTRSAVYKNLRYNKYYKKSFSKKKKKINICRTELTHHECLWHFPIFKHSTVVRIVVV